MTLLSDTQIVEFLIKYLDEVARTTDEEGNVYWQIWTGEGSVEGPDFRAVVSAAAVEMTIEKLSN